LFVNRYMASSNNSGNNPLTFDLPEVLLEKIVKAQEQCKAKSMSDLIRHALIHFNFETYIPEKQEHKQISVRLPDDVRKQLQQVSKKKKVSIGELLRAALDSMPKNLTTTPEKTMVTKKTTTKKTVKKAAPKKKAVKKTVAKKAVKKTVKKAVKKTVKKVASKAKKAVKKTVKKAVKKAAPAKKTVKKVVKKAAPKTVKKAVKKATK